MREPAPKIVTPHYVRPNQPWVCGLIEVGETCPAGPTASGQCPALGACHPRLMGDRWECNRSRERGGPCDDGPTPDGKCACIHRCQPVRSLRAKRGRLVGACTALVVGLLMIAISAGSRDQFISPGALTRHHGQLLAGQTHHAAGIAGESNCALCHSEANSGPLTWTATTVGLRAHETPQSQLCMNCHDTTIPPEHALMPHGMAAEVLRQITDARRDRSVDATHPGLLQALGATAHPPSDGVACASCHREHQGATFDMTSMTNSACQACHQQRYESFATDHPDFGRWPYEHRTPIAFDHVSHANTHFVQKGETFDCRRCHVEDATQGVQLLTNYEAACASCHDEKITTSIAPGVAILALPTLDVDALRQAGHPVADWPERATGDFDGRLPPMMKLLLGADPGAAKAMALLGPDFEFFDVDPNDDVQLEACADLAAAIRDLVSDLNNRGPIAVRERLADSLGVSISAGEARELVSALSRDTMLQVANAWRPDGSIADSSWEEPSLLATKPGSPKFAPSGGWTYDETTFTLSYRPAAHADPLLASWLSLLVTTPDVEKRPLELAMLRELARPTGPGLCASCHSIEKTTTGHDATHLAIHWTARDRSVSRGFTKFAHGPHVALPQLADCTACHALATSSTAAPSYDNWDSHDFVSEFRPMTKQQCATCHTAQASGDQCQQCHHYHVDTIETWRFE